MLDEPFTAELVFALDAAEVVLLPSCDDVAEALARLTELAGDLVDPLEGTLPETSELGDRPSLLRPLVDESELVCDPLWLALPVRLGDRVDAPLCVDEGPCELAPLDGWPELGNDDPCELAMDFGEDAVLDAPLLDATTLADDGIADDDAWLSPLDS